MTATGHNTCAENAAKPEVEAGIRAIQQGDPVPLAEELLKRKESPAQRRDVANQAKRQVEQ